MTKKVLVVDDQHVDRSAKAQSLKMIGCNVDEAAGGLAALQRFIADNYDVILMDYDMPFMSGPACAQKIREYEAGTAYKAFIIGVTATLNKQVEEKCINAGMDVCIDTASSTDRLQRIVESL